MVVQRDLIRFIVLSCCPTALFGSELRVEWFLPAFAQWFEAMGLVNQPVILVGHSMGAMLATEWARRHPSTVRLLALTSAPVYDTSHIALELRFVHGHSYEWSRLWLVC